MLKAQGTLAMHGAKALAPRRDPIPASAGIGIKPEHSRALLSDVPSLAFIEVHVENYFGLGGPPHRYLTAIAEHYPLSFHGVGLSLGGTDPLDKAHLWHWRMLVDRYTPALISEHVAWSRYQDLALHDLLPIPYTEESLDVLCLHINEMQDALRRRILIENSSTYIELAQSSLSEPEFLVEAARRTGCGLLLDINNVYVSTRNQGQDARSWLLHIPDDLVLEIHLAGDALIRQGDETIRIDEHGSEVASEVWALYRETIARIGRRPTLIEWDRAVPALNVLVREAERANVEADAARSIRTNVGSSGV